MKCLSSPNYVDYSLKIKALVAGKVRGEKEIRTMLMSKSCQVRSWPTFSNSYSTSS